MKSNPRAFLKYANSTRKSKPNIGPLKDSGKFTNKTKDMSEILSKQYKSVFVDSGSFSPTKLYGQQFGHGPANIVSPNTASSSATPLGGSHTMAALLNATPAATASNLQNTAPTATVVALQNPITTIAIAALQNVSSTTTVAALQNTVSLNTVGSTSLSLPPDAPVDSSNGLPAISPLPNASSSSSGYHNSDLTEGKLLDAIKEMNANSAPGPDGIPAFFYRDYADILVKPIQKIWRMSLDSGTMPEGTAQAVITPQHKGGSRCDPANYRPVALTNHLTKIFERVLRKDLVNYLESNNLTNDSQHGFRAGRSTITQLLSYQDDIINKLETGEEVDSIYLDFAKAFDKVDHGILLKKLYDLNIRGRVLIWIESFLRNREQRVKVSDSLSDPVPVTSGVPQGSVLGPLLFLVMMLDIDKDVQKSDLGSFADDTKVWGGIDLSNVEECSKDLQTDLNSLFIWAEANNMKFNEAKFQCISFGNSGRTPQYTTASNQDIKVKDCVKDLGVLLEDNLHFHNHIKNMAAKGHRIAEWALRTISNRSTATLLTLLKSLVLPQIEYASIVWTPHDQLHINLLEGVQRRFTSRFPQFRQFDSNLGIHICTTTYEERIKALNLYSVQRRHERYLILFIYKIVNGHVPNPGLCWKCHPRTKLRVEPKRTLNPSTASWVSRARDHSFFVRAPRLFNRLPANLKELDDNVGPSKPHVEAYKRKLDKYLSQFLDRPGDTNNGLPQDLSQQLPLTPNAPGP